MSAPISKVRYAVLIPAVAVILATLLTWLAPVDVALARLFFDRDYGWPVGRTPGFEFAYRYGQLLGFLPALLAIGILVAGYRDLRFRPWRRSSVFMILLLAVGPGLLVNTIFKAEWNRPRPREIAEFGGPYEYQRALVIGADGEGRKSFPSGHAAMGFIFVAPYFVMLARSRRVALGWLAFGIAWGIFIGAARIAQGAHWLSDVIWSFGVVYFTAYALARLLHLDRIDPDEQPARAIDSHSVLQ
ncbi:MAG TPA: phosphatase PAP2 family protein [Opitutales bacterium]|nr:phosphatase PAP2 family protein [Opitutales bacterium]